MANPGHLESVLRALRGINRLVAGDYDQVSLLKRACGLLHEDRGYFSAWVGLRRPMGFALVAEAGLGDDADEFSRYFGGPILPACCREVAVAGGVSIRRDTERECLGCPLATRRNGAAALVGPLVHGGTDYGILVVSVPLDLVDNPDEVTLFQEVLGTLALALHAQEEEAVARSSRSKLEAALGSITDAVCIADAEGKIMDFNAAFVEFHRLPSREACQAVLDSFPDLYEEGFAGQGPAPVSDWPLARALRGERGTNAEYWVRRREDGLTWLGSYSFTPLRDGAGRINGAVLVGRDITASRRAEDFLRESEARFSRIFNGSPAPIAITRYGDGVFLDVNESFVRLFGYSRQEIVGRNALDLGLWPSQSREDFFLGLSASATMENLELRGHRKDGEVRDLLASLELMELDGEPCVLGILTDITERKRIEARLSLALEDEESLLRELYHRTRNNMLTIIGMMSLRATGRPSMGLPEFVEDMSQRIQAMALVHERLYRYRNLSRIDLGDFLAELARLVLARSEVADRVALRLDLTPVTILIDTATPLAIVLNELLLNSVAHAFPDGRRGEVFLGLTRSASGLIEVRLEDDGAGFPADTSPASGLGLNLIWSIMEQQLKGKITVAKGGGTRYLLTFKDDLYQERV